MSFTIWGSSFHHRDMNRVEWLTAFATASILGLSVTPSVAVPLVPGWVGDSKAHDSISLGHISFTLATDKYNCIGLTATSRPWASSSIAVVCSTSA